MCTLTVGPKPRRVCPGHRDECGHAQAQDGYDGSAPTHHPRFRCHRLGGGPQPPTHILSGKPQPDLEVPASLLLPHVLTWDFSNLNIRELKNRDTGGGSGSEGGGKDDKGH